MPLAADSAEPRGPDRADEPIHGAPDEARLKQVMGRFVTGVTVVTAVEGGHPLGFTCQSFVSLSLAPPLVALAPAKSSTSWPRMSRARMFCVNVLAVEQAEIARAFSVSGGDKFVGVAWKPGATGAPVIDGALAFVECRLELVHDAGDHEIVVGAVVEAGARDGAPLVFYRSGFERLAL